MKECDECHSKQRDAHGPVDGLPDIVHNVIRQPGRPLDPSVRDVMETRLGHDFSTVPIYDDGMAAQSARAVEASRVRVHTDALAAASARAVQSRAYTVGRHVVFGEGQYEPATTAGRRLLAHELTHVVQQRNARAVPPSSLQIGESDNPAEREADKCSEAGFVHGQVAAAPASELLQRAPDDPDGRTTQDPLTRPMTEEEWDHVYFWIAYGSVGTDPLTDDPDRNAALVANAIFCHRYLFTSQAGDPLLCVVESVTAGDPRAQAVKREVTRRGPIRYSAAFVAGTDRPQIRAYYFPGTTNRNAMIVGGVHGSERAGVQVVELILDMLRTPDPTTGRPRRPAFNVVVVPELFPANVAAGRRRTPGQKDPNRQMPARGEVVGARRGPQGRPLSAIGEPIEPENLVLLDLVDTFKPERIAMVHGVASGRLAGVSTDPRPGQEATDDELAFAMAQEAVRRGARAPGNVRPGGRRGRYDPGATGEPTRYPTQRVAHERGVTFGQHGSQPAGPRPAMNVILIETFMNYRIEQRSGRARAERRVELTALATVLREIFLERP